MILGSRYQEVRPGTFRTLYSFRCDYCQKEYEKYERTTRREKPLHYCSVKCANEDQKRNGLLDHHRRSIYQESIGVDYPLQSQAVKAKSQQTCLAKYGVENVQQVPEIKARSCQTFLERLEKRQKCLGVWVSKAENDFYSRLLEYFEESDIVRQKYVSGTHRPIDFYIKSRDVYVQFDGVYWHGLDRPINIIRERTNQHSQEIANRWDRDREQDRWFQDHQMKLVRVTDVEFDKLPFDHIIERIKNV